MAKKPAKINTSTLEDGPIGAGPDGGLVVVQKDDPPFKVKVVDDDGNEVEMEDDD